jgi:hypothetical protein
MPRARLVPDNLGGAVRLLEFAERYHPDPAEITKNVLVGLRKMA